MLSESIRTAEELAAFNCELPPVEVLLAKWQAVAAAAFAAERAEATKPAVNVVRIDGPRASADYKVTPFATTWGHGFTVSKIGGAGSYSVLVGARGEHDRCDCADATFRPHRRGGCKHIRVCRELLAAGGVAAPKPVSSPRDTADQGRW